MRTAAGVDIAKHGAMDTRMDRGNGFNLIELTVTVALLATLTAVATPSISGIWRRANIWSAYHAMSSSLALARIQAVSRGHPVTLCPSSDGASCSGGVDWSQGWIAYLDPKRQAQPRSASDVVEVAPSLRGAVSMRSSAGRQRIRYHASGWASGSNLRLTLCTPAADALVGSIVINNAGRARVEQAVAGHPCPYDP